MSDRNLDLLAKAERLAKLHYSVKMYRDTLSDGTIVYVAEHPELMGCMGQGATQLEAYHDLDGARLDYIYTLLEDGLDVPLPAGMDVQSLGADYSIIAAYDCTTRKFTDLEIVHHRKKSS